jgi:hypothetical protein
MTFLSFRGDFFRINATLYRIAVTAQALKQNGSGIYPNL